MDEPQGSPRVEVVDGPPSPSPQPAPAIVSVDLVRPARGLIRLIYSHNPFYVLSAWLVFSGLRMSFNTTGTSFETGALMAGLAGYTLLMALAAWLLIRLGKVWDDVRTQLLLIVLMLLAMSVSFDDALTKDPRTGAWYFWGGLAFAVAVSEGLLRGLGITLPALFRLPYYLVLALFFVYPVAISPLLADIDDPRLHWALFAFSSLAGVLFLTLLPAIRRGPQYVAENGTPWRWPLFPWALFGVLALGVCGRSYYVCISLHFLGDASTIFRPYFLAPFVLSVAVLVLEIGLVSRARSVIHVALAIPLAALALAAVGSGWQGRDFGFLDRFTATLGASPFFLTLCALIAFYALAVLRRVPAAPEWLTAALVALVFYGPGSVGPENVATPRGVPLLAAAGVQLWFALRERNSRRSMFAACCGIAGLTLQLQGTPLTFREALGPAHLLLAAALLVGAAYRDRFAKLLQHAAAAAILAAGLVAATAGDRLSVDLPPLVVHAYPLVATAVAAAYGYLAWNRVHFLAAGGVLGAWLAAVGCEVYCQLRQWIAGLDQIAWGAAFFLVALLLSLTKTGIPQRWLARRPKSL